MENVARIGNIRNANKIVAGKLKEEITWQKETAKGRKILK
jgi:hypothetical protein